MSIRDCGTGLAPLAHSSRCKATGSAAVRAAPWGRISLPPPAPPYFLWEKSSVSRGTTRAVTMLLAWEMTRLK